nr:LysR family transcriptional regulator [Pseudomonadota bacterium]
LVGHPKFKKLISKKQLDQNDITALMQLPWIAYSEILLFIKEYFHTVFHQEFHGNLKLVIPDLWAMLAAVTAGVGVTILPTYFCQEMIAEKKIVILYETPKAPSHYFYIGWKQGALRDPKVKFVYDLFKRACIQT